MDLSTQTPVEIDTELARLYGQQIDAGLAYNRALDGVHYAADDQYHARYNSRSGWKMTSDEAIDAASQVANGETYKASQAQRALDSLNIAESKVAEISMAMAPLNAEFNRRRWTRAFLVQANNGHVHSSMGCSTCFDTTQYAWMFEYSGQDESEIVEAAGEKACTICYPSAPVDVLKRPTKMFGPDQIAAKVAREERAAAKVARDAKKIAKGLTADGSEFVVHYTEKNAGGHERDADGKSIYVRRDRARREFFKTEQSAVQWVVQNVTWNGWNTDEADGFRQVIEAVATKHGKSVEAVTEEILAKVAAKAKRDSRY